MAYIKAVTENEATGKTQEIYEAAQNKSGYIPNYTRLFGHRPEVYEAWGALLGSISANMPLRRYELVTVAAARQLGSTYCMLAHGDVILNKMGVDEAQLTAIVQDYHAADLSADEVAVMAFAEKVIQNAGSITQDDVDRLKTFGLSDADILDVTLAATARSFFSKTLDALNAIPDDKYKAFSAELLNVLSVGRPFPEAE
ncbi:MAG: peroxidase-related enzyme [Chloroflexi bacterium]|nr:peroxidase-related enzyme [Chloroflexota bacterium]